MKALHLRQFHPHFSEFGDYLLADLKLENTDGVATQDMSRIVIPVFRTIAVHQTLAVRNCDFRYTLYSSDRVVCGIDGLTPAGPQVSYSK